MSPRRRRAGTKAKKVSYELIPASTEIGRPIYQLLAQLVKAHHREILPARIAIAWSTAWKADVDGRLTLGKCKKASDLDRELAAFDFIILLNREFWMSLDVSDHQRKALLDHELCHATVSYGDDGEAKVDERGRTVYRIRKHDIEEFGDIVERHGVYKRDLEAFARALRRAERSVAGVFIGYTGLCEQLAALGVAVPLETIVAWTSAQRTDAAIWAQVKRESVVAPATPAFIAEAMAQPDHGKTGTAA